MNITTLKELLVKGQFVVQSVKTLTDEDSLIEIIFDEVPLEEGVFQRDILICKFSIQYKFDMDSFKSILSEKYPDYELSKESIIERLGIIFYDAIDLIVNHNYPELVDLFNSKRGKIASVKFGL